MVPSRRTSRYTKRRPSLSVQIRTAYLAWSRVRGRGRSWATSEPVMRGWMIIRWPLDSRNTACLARRVICSIVLPRNVLISRALETRRKTSVLLSCTRAMRNPSSRGASSRTIVSTSGSSGTLDLAPGDIAPPGFALEGNPLRSRAARSRGQRDVRAQTRDVQDAPAAGAQPPLRVPERAGVKYDRSEEHTSELQSQSNLVCRLLLEKKKVK